MKGKLVTGPASDAQDLNGLACELIGRNKVRLIEGNAFYSIGDEVQIKAGEFEPDVSDSESDT